MRHISLLVAAGLLWGCGETAPAEVKERAQVVGRIQGTEFLVPSDAHAVWLAADPLGALRVSEQGGGCGSPAGGWSFVVQVNTDSDAAKYAILADAAQATSPGTGHLREYRRTDGRLDMPREATGELIVSYAVPEFVSGALILRTDDSDLVTVFEAPVCPATALVAP